MSQFNWNSVKPAGQVEEFAEKAVGRRSPQDILIENIDRQLDLFDDPKEDGRRWFTSGKTHTAFTIRFANKPLKLRGEETKMAVETAQFPDAMQYIKEQVKKGAYDAQLAEFEKLLDKRREKAAETRASKSKEG